ncbi:uncharacterized protein [Euwallacea similis]|uniref:uncharacterized protein n=1 Tax=Euwallacea similis TaxID=1736056 RepID=UPI00344CDDFC
MQSDSRFTLAVFLSIMLLGYSGITASKKKHSRVRRYLAFPEGAVFSAIFCLTSLMGVTPGSDLFSLNINYALGYELPNDTKPLFDAYKPAMKRRNRRDLYGRVEIILNSMGYDGRSCLLRSLCEAKQKLSNEEGLVYKTLGLIFRFPQEPLYYSEPDIHRIYHYAAQAGNEVASTDPLNKCQELFPCPFSLVDLALGYYSTPVP